MTIEEVRTAAKEAGLAFRGAFHPDAGGLPAEEDAQTLVMLGFVGGEQWDNFTASPEYRDGKPHPLDRWSYRVISAMARGLGAKACFPFTGPPFMPFVRWAQKAEPVYPSEIGMLIHPDFGLWHAWRGALLFEEKLALPPMDDRPRPCDTCSEKPCLSACPVNALAGEGAYDTPACAAHIKTADGEPCMSRGCLARRACPVGRKYQYPSEQAAFHMKSFRDG